MVDKGKVCNTSREMLHHKPLPDGFLKVSVGVVLEGGALLTLPDDVADATLVADAIGSFVAWSPSLVCVDNEVCLKSFTIQFF